MANEPIREVVVNGNTYQIEADTSAIEAQLTAEDDLEFQFSKSGSKYGYKDANGNFVPFKNPTGTKSITANGTYDVTDYASVSINVDSGNSYFGGARGLFSARMQGQNLGVYDGNGKYLGTSATVKKAGTYTFSIAGTGSNSYYGSAMYISVNGTAVVSVGTGSAQHGTNSTTKYLNVGDVLRFYPSNADFGQTFDGIACVVLNG